MKWLAEQIGGMVLEMANIRGQTARAVAERDKKIAELEKKISTDAGPHADNYSGVEVP
jgi:hypothetical protein